MSFRQYQTDQFFDELIDDQGQPRAGAALLIDRIENLPDGDIRRRQTAAEAMLMNLGITFAVYGDESGAEKIFPFDIVPRIIEQDDWRLIDTGLKQRITALNMFINDVYHDQKILKDGVIPADVILSADSLRKQCMGMEPPQGIWCHITGTDLIRDRDGQLYVLEDNLRCPSGVSYVLENREVLKRTFPSVFAASNVQPVDDYPSHLFDTLRYIAPGRIPAPTVVVLTPGRYNSAYFEHSYLAKQMGVQLVEPQDLFIHEGYVVMNTIYGPKRVDVIYRRIDDDFIDPKVFREDSLLGVPGIMDVYREGRVALANAPGTGVADDKVVYAYVPDMIKYYLSEDPIVPNVPTYLCWRDADRQHTLANLESLVVKPANQSGGYGMLMGPSSTAEERAEFADKIKAKPRDFIAQPVMALSRAPVIVGDHFEGRHVDLRPYVLYGQDIWVLPGGLTRVALRKGSLVVNSSQGGGSKDTWVVGAEAPTPTQMQQQRQRLTY